MKLLVKPTAVADVLKPQGCTNLKLRQLTRRVSQHYDLALAKTGLKTTQYSLLSHVVKLGPIRAVDLAGVMHMSTSTLSRNLQPLVAAGWVTLGPGPDRRSRQAMLTDAGRALRVQDLKYPERFAVKLRELLDLHNHVLTTYLGSRDMAWDAKLGDLSLAASYDEVDPRNTSVGTRKALMPLAPCASVPVRANTTATSAWSAREMEVFSPLMTK